MKNVLYSVLILITLSSTFSCEEDIADCPNNMCLVAGGWKLTEIYIDDEKENSDLSQYSLILNMPENPEDETSVFNRVQANGTTDNGMWSLENDNEVLRLMPDGGAILTEEWIIKTLSPRKMILVITRDTSIKEGPGKIEMTLEPF